MTPSLKGARAKRTTKAEKLAQRARCIGQIAQLLAGGPMTAAALNDVLQVHGSTCYAYLRSMHLEQRTIRKSAVQSDGSILWELGADPTLPSADEALDQSFAQRQRTVPATQVGMWRDALVTFLFGPAACEVTA